MEDPPAGQTGWAAWPGTSGWSSKLSVVHKDLVLNAFEGEPEEGQTAVSALCTKRS